MRFLKFRPWYALAALVLLIVEVLIAVFVNDKIIRPFLGDVIVIGLIYCTVRAFLKIDVAPAIFFTLVFAVLVETLQYLNFIEWAGLESSRLARTVLGSSFSWVDIACYFVGGGIVLAIERLVRTRSSDT